MFRSTHGLPCTSCSCTFRNIPPIVVLKLFYRAVALVPAGVLVLWISQAGMLRLPLLMLLVGSSASSLAAESDARQASVPHHDELRGAQGARDASPLQQPLAAARSVWPAPALAGAAAIRSLAGMDQDEVQGSEQLDDFGRLLEEAGSGSGSSGEPAAPPPPASPPPSSPLPPSPPPSPLPPPPLAAWLSLRSTIA